MLHAKSFSFVRIEDFVTGRAACLCTTHRSSSARTCATRTWELGASDC